MVQNCPAQPTPRGGLHTFTGTVSNPGNVTLTNVFVVNSQPALNTAVIGPITLIPGQSVNFTGSYTAPAACCEILNTLTARGQDHCAGTTVTATSSVICPLLSTPRLAVTRVCPAAIVPVGGTIVFQGTVSNTGDVHMTNVFVYSGQPASALTWRPGTSGGGLSLASVSSQNNASRAAAALADAWSCQGPNLGRSAASLAGNNTPILRPIELAPGESKSFSGSYVVTAGSNPATDIVRTTGTDTCRARTVSATANCAGPVLAASPVISSVTSANGLVTVSWKATPGSIYCLQSQDTAQEAWVNVSGNVTATSATASKSDAMGSSQQRFYRVMVVQE